MFWDGLELNMYTVYSLHTDFPILKWNFKKTEENMKKMMAAIMK